MPIEDSRSSAGREAGAGPWSPAPDLLQIRDGVAVLHPRGKLSLVEATDLVAQAIAACRERLIAQLLVDSRDIVDLPIPSLIDRFLMAEDWAHAAKGQVHVCLVAAPEYVHPEKFGVMVARKLGLTCNVHTSREDAHAWLAEVRRTSVARD
ncbi:MAG: hypothetical protein U1F41_05235 [Burkholderiales bacterium]